MAINLGACTPIARTTGAKAASAVTASIAGAVSKGILITTSPHGKTWPVALVQGVGIAGGGASPCRWAIATISA